MPLPHKLGSLSPVIYFQNSYGYVVLAPYSDFPTPRGFERREAGDLPSIDKLTERLTSQERRIAEREHQYECAVEEVISRRVNSLLMSRLVSSSTPEAAKDFIREYLKLRIEKRARYHARFAEYATYHFHAREFDLGDRPADQERTPENLDIRG
jgi:hypothetical protein